YAFLPWLFLAAVSYLRKQSKKKLVLFALVALLAAPMAHTATLWYVFLLVFVLFLVPFFKKNGAIVLLIVLLAVNSFWLLPNLYFLKSSAFFVPQAKVNKIFSEEAFAHNQNYGKLLDVIIFKNFLFDWKIYSGVENDQYDDLLAGFKKHLQKTEVLGIGYLAAILVFLGMLIAWKENNFSKAMVLPTVVVIVFLANNNFIFNLFFSLFKLLLPFLGEALRLPFTKFSIPLMFFFACFFALGSQKLLDKTNKYANISLFFISLLLVFYCWPFFKGELISKQMQVNIPKEYFAVFDWFNNQPQGRVVQLPIHSFWNWVYYKWGFQGAYFTPFGIKQPVLDRDYDRWNLDNERAFRELSYAVYSQDMALFDSVLSKYQIAYLLLDKNVLAPGLNQDKKVLFNSQLESMLLSAGDRIKLARRFNNVSIYQVIKPAPIVRSAKKFTTISTINKGADIDWVYKNSGDYIVSSAASSFYPFYAISDNQNFLTKDFANLSEIFQGQNILSSDYLNYEQYLPLDVYAAFDNNTLTIKLATKLSKNQKTMQFSHPIQPTDDQYGFLSLDNHQNLKLKELKKDFTYQGSFYLSTKAVNNLSFYSYQSVWQKDNFQIIVQPELCKPSSFAEAGLSILQDGYKLSAKNTSSCIRIPLSKLLEEVSINSLRSLLQIDFKVKPVNLEMTGHYCLLDKTVKRCVKEKKGILAGTVFDYLTLGAGDIDKWDLILYADNVGKLQTKEIIYQDLAVQVKQLEASWTIVPEDIKELLGKNLHLEKETILSLWEKMPNTEVEVLEKGHPVTSCSENSPQQSDRIRNISKTYLEYQSTNGSLCDYFSFPNLPHNLGYLVSLQTQAVSGLSLRVCLANPYSKRCDIFSALPKNNQFV
ncbi:MAG: hypothetical protein Q7R43_04055, partial [Candidatus Daviesbacteria bacterium]|nr:hypothetical protein [Candidatus Daviesbacteria bacterium]